MGSLIAEPCFHDCKDTYPPEYGFSASPELAARHGIIQQYDEISFCTSITTEFRLEPFF